MIHVRPGLLHSRLDGFFLVITAKTSSRKKGQYGDHKTDKTRPLSTALSVVCLGTQINGCDREMKEETVVLVSEFTHRVSKK